MRLRLSSFVFDALSIGALPVAGALLQGLSSQSPSARVTIAPPGARSPLTNITMTQANLQWDAPSTSAGEAPYRMGGAAFPEILDAMDANGRHYGGDGIECGPRSATVVQCTLYYPDARDHAPWATIVLSLSPSRGASPITLRVHPE
jgi:hypothetical protein